MTNLTIEDIEKYNLEVQAQEDGTVNIADIIEASRKQGRELALQDKDLIEPIKEGAKKEASAIERKRALKAMRDKFGLELSNSQIDEMKIEDALDLIHASATSKTSADIKELQDKIIEANRKAAEAEETANSSISQFKKEYESKFAKKELEKQVMTVAASEKLIIPANEALELFNLKLQQSGYFVKLDEGGKVSIYKDEAGTYPVLRKDGTGRAEVADLFNDFLDSFKQRNNGSGGSGGKGDSKPAPKQASAHRQRLAAAFGHR